MSAVRGSGKDPESRCGHERNQRLIESGHFLVLIREGASRCVPLCPLPWRLVG